MGLTVIVNNMTVSHKGSSGISTAFPDVCKTPAPPAPPVPIPYPNIAQSGDVTKGSKKVKFDKKSICLKKSKLKTSTGDEAGTLKGIVSSKIKGKGQFQNYSFDVKVEGSNVCRLGDPTSQNMGSMNTAAFFHVQVPGLAPPGDEQIVEEACENMEKKAKEQDNSPAGVSNVSGIHPRHVTAIQKVVDKQQRWVMFFRGTNPLCIPWIATHNNEPKPHWLTAGKTIKPPDVPAVQRWLRQNRKKKHYKRCGGNAATLTGVVRSTLSGGMANMPHLGTGSFRRGWITGDYDLMDVQGSDYPCHRISDEDFGALKEECNKAMRWPGIQHGPQSKWDTKTDHEFKGEEDFDVGAILDDWANKDKAAAVADIPAKNIAPGRAPLPMVDNNLTVIAPGGAAHLPEHADFWDALACCGCRYYDPETKKAKK